MITKSRKKISYRNLKFINNSVFKTKLDNSCIISSFYTMQFIHVSKRQKLVNKIFKSLIGDFAPHEEALKDEKS